MEYKYLVLEKDSDYTFFKSLEDLKEYLKSDFYFDLILYVFSIDYINGQMFLQQIVHWEQYID